jgi:murein DD-endopeptidase MepM/ murein hydrolase activator NlpD
VKKAALLLGGLCVALLAWLASSPSQGTDPSQRTTPSHPKPVIQDQPPTAAMSRAAPRGLYPLKRPAVAAATAAPVVPTVAGSVPAADRSTSTTAANPVAQSEVPEPRPLIVPVSGIDPSALKDMFDEVRGNRRHEAIDILAPRGTPVIATDDGVVKKLFTSVPGGLTIYQFDPDERYCYYYAHLDHYTAGLHEGQHLQKGEVIAYVGTTGNAPKETPHLHFALIRLDPDKRWWKGTYVNPYPLLYQPRKP